MKSWKITIWLVVAVAMAMAMTVAFALTNEVQPATAAGTGGCMEDVCGSQVCTANDVTISIITTYEMVDPCRYVGDTGIYYFLAILKANAALRYDPGFWVALDGVDARIGECYSDYLRAPLQSTGLPATGDLWGPPFWDVEYADNGATDQCGDLIKDQINYEVFGPVTISCTQKLMDGLIDTCVSWQQNVGANCPANNACPGTAAKCNCQTVGFEVNINLVDLSLVKTASISELPLEDFTFDYYFSVSNQSYSGSCYQSTGYTIDDDLPIWLKASTPLPDQCTSEPDTDEACYPNCQGYGDELHCNIQLDLGCPASAPLLTMPVEMWHGDPVVTDPSDPRYGTPNPPSIPNTACVRGNEVDPVEANNCDVVDVVTEVELRAFTAAWDNGSVALSWETTSETDNLGFNVYRSKTIDGKKKKINEGMIPTLVYPGSLEGAFYSFSDNSVKKGVTYYYWLEDVNIYGRTTLHGAVEVLGGWLRNFQVTVPDALKKLFRGPVDFRWRSR